jgi:PleD family two-component response regulator
MQTQEYPLIFIVDDNCIYNNLIASQLKSNKFQRVESFISGAECVKNLYKKPDIVIQDYLTSELIGEEIQNESKKSNLNAEFVFLSGLDNFSKEIDQNTKLCSLSAFDKFNVSADTIKYGPHDYVVKDLVALAKLIEKFNKKKNIWQFKKQIRGSFNLFSIAVASFFLSRSVWQ